MSSMQSKWGNCATTSAADAFSILNNSKYHRVILYDHSPKQLIESVRRVYELIKRQNSTIPNINNQFVPTNPYYFDDIDGCTPVRCAEISMDMVENTLGTIALFTGYNESVLVDTPDNKAEDVPIGIPGKKAMASLALLGSMVR